MTDRRPSLGNIALDDISTSFRRRDVESNIALSPEPSYRERSTPASPEMGSRALRGQSGFNEGRAAESGFTGRREA